MEVVLLGATGFVGRRLLQRLLESSQISRVRALVRCDLNRLPSHAKLHAISGSLPCVPEELIPNDSPHVILHFATLQRAHNASEFSVNQEGMTGLLALCNSFTRGVVYGSSLSVLGQQEQRYALPSAPCHPDTPLARSRRDTEEALQKAASEKRILWAIMRPRFIVDSHDPQTLCAWLRLVRRGLWFGTGTQAFSVFSVLDYSEAVTAVATAMFAQKIQSQILGVGYRRGLVFSDMWHAFRSLQGLQGPPRIRIPIWLPSALRSFHLAESLATRCELMSFDHTVNVDGLERIIGSEILNKNPLDVVCGLARQSLAEGPLAAVA